MKNKIAAVLTLSLLTLLSFGKNITNANAAIATKPSDYLWGEYFTPGGWRNYVSNNSASGYSSSQSSFYERTGTSPNFNYVAPLRTVIPGATPNNGVAFSSGFASSSTTWGFTGSFYFPNSISVGSNVSSNITKGSFTISNGTTNGYYFWLDLSGNTSNINLDVYYVSLNEPRQVYTSINFATQMNRIYVPARTTMFISLQASTSPRFVDGWFITLSDDFATSIEAELIYDAGFVAGYDAGLSSDLNMATLMGTVMNAIGGIMNISILGNITLGALALFPLLGIMIMFFKKVIQ
jgi:hypothetical protein